MEALWQVAVHNFNSRVVAHVSVLSASPFLGGSGAGEKVRAPSLAQSAGATHRPGWLRQRCTELHFSRSFRSFHEFQCGAKKPVFLNFAWDAAKRERSRLRAFETASFLNLILLQNACITNVTMKYYSYQVCLKKLPGVPMFVASGTLF